MEKDRRETLKAGIETLGLSVPAGVQERMLAYLDLMARWNRVFNLTSRRDTGDWVARHLLDSVAVLPYINGVRVIDVGSGAGVPGVPLALADGALRVTLLDGNAKKTRFMTQAAIDLQLANVEVVAQRAEHYHPSALFDCAISRAFATIGDFVDAAAHLVAPEGKMLAMKGAYPVDELDRLPAGFAIEAVHVLAVPHLAAQRHLVVIVRSTVAP